MLLQKSKVPSASFIAALMELEGDQMNCFTEDEIASVAESVLNHPNQGWANNIKEVEASMGGSTSGK